MTSTSNEFSKRFNGPIVKFNDWRTIPPIGNLDAYISAVKHMPMLELDEEQEYGRKLRENGDIESAQRLILSHLKLVVTVARKYMGYKLALGDLISEGNIGLMKAVRAFDPDQGVRLSTYAMHWIKSEINEFVIRNIRSMKIATTKAQRKLFFNLRSMKQKFQSEDGSSGKETFRTTMTANQVATVAKALNVKEEEVVEMEMRLNGTEVTIDPGPDDSGEEGFGPIAYLSDESYEPSHIVEARRRDTMAVDGLQSAMVKLDERSRKIIEDRWLNVNDDASGGKTLGELAVEHGVSAERIRQIEVAAMKKMRVCLAEYA